MTWFSKYMLLVSVIGLVGIPIFIFDWNDFSWRGNKEYYWGMISFFAVIIAVLINYKSNRLKNNNKKFS